MFASVTQIIHEPILHAVLSILLFITNEGLGYSHSFLRSGAIENKDQNGFIEIFI